MYIFIKLFALIEVKQKIIVPGKKKKKNDSFAVVFLLTTDLMGQT